MTGIVIKPELTPAPPMRAACSTICRRSRERVLEPGLAVEIEHLKFPGMVQFRIVSGEIRQAMSAQACVHRLQEDFLCGDRSMSDDRERLIRNLFAAYLGNDRQRVSE